MNDAEGSSAACQLRPEDLKVHCFSLDWGSGSNYPLDNMSFYKPGLQSTQPEICSLPRFGSTQIRPKENIEYKLRVFVRDARKEALAR